MATLSTQPGQPGQVISDAGRILKRLDRIYVDTYLLQQRISSGILLGSTLSDHLPVVAVFQLGPHGGSKKSGYQMNVSSFQDPKLKEQIPRLWTQWQEKYESSNSPAHDAQILHQKDGQVLPVVRKKQTAIHCLQDENGQMVEDEEAILNLAIRYFSQILQELPPDAERHSVVEDLLFQTNAKVTTEEKEALSKNLTVDEVHTAAKLLGRNKCPGPDGVPLEFFLIYWETIAPLIFKATADGLQQGTLVPFFNRGIIALLSKDGDATLLKNKRLITLLNAIYKIWAKALQLRLTPILQRLITWEQNSFLPGRQLHSTVLLCSEVVHHAKQIGQPCVLLKIDFRKAFDTLNWEFLYQTMKKMDFGENFIDMVAALNENARSSIRINNTCSRTFGITRSELTLARREELDRKVARKLAIVTLRFKVVGDRLHASWRPP
ncbi:hypothetical protein R1sor_002953 [Riccia sorocarpa]|uniref:Reverse transcriptase domain-containing protein n=1 Tax=Riccia sorocarpa TaxID=122646 RepID=A0ABD3H2C4_9MARC